MQELVPDDDVVTWKILDLYHINLVSSLEFAKRIRNHLYILIDYRVADKLINNYSIFTVVSHIYTYDRAQNILNFVQPLQKLIL